MIQRAVTAIIGVVIGLFATFAVFGAILGGLDNFYLLTQHTCIGPEDNEDPQRFLRVAIVTSGNTSAPNRLLLDSMQSTITDRTSPEDIDWDHAYTVRQDGDEFGHCTVDFGTTSVTLSSNTSTAMTPIGDTFTITVDNTAAGGRGGTPVNTLNIGNTATATTTPDLRWIRAEEVFTRQGELVELLAVIAAIGMPLGAMTAVVFFGQAVVSSGVSGNGASQVLVAIAAVVIILVAVQMFQQFASYLGDAFDAVDGDRFVVFNHTLGQLAETIAEFWGVLAFAGLINIATIVWRNYNGNMSIGGGAG